MKRRTFITIIVSLGLISMMSFADKTLDYVAYTPGLIKKELAAGKTLFVIYASDWCITCIRQERIIKQLRSSNPEYDRRLTFIRVDWSDYGDAEVTTSRNIPRRSTLLVLRGDKEIARNIAGTNSNIIKALIEKGL